jgi:hypothetical protein
MREVDGRSERPRVAGGRLDGAVLAREQRKVRESVLGTQRGIQSKQQVRAKSAFIRRRCAELRVGRGRRTRRACGGPAPSTSFGPTTFTRSMRNRNHLPPCTIEQRRQKALPSIFC